MAIFANTRHDYDIPTLEGYSVETCGHMDAAIESFADDLAVMEAMHAYDMAEIEGLRRIAALREAGEEEEAEEAEEELEATKEAKGSEIFAKIKEKLKKLWAKVKTFFASVKRFILSLFQSGEKFVSTNSKAIDAAISAGVTVEATMYAYEWKELVADPENAVKMSDEHFNKLKSHLPSKLSKKKGTATEREGIKSTFENLTNNYIKSWNVSDESELDEAFFNKYRGANAKVKGKSVVTVKSSNLKEMKEFLLKAKASIASVKAAESKADSGFKSIVEEAEKLEKSATAGSFDAYHLQLASTFVTKMNTITNKFFNAWTSAIKEAQGVAKAVLRKACTTAGYKLAAGSSEN